MTLSAFSKNFKYSEVWLSSFVPSGPQNSKITFWEDEITLIMLSKSVAGWVKFPTSPTATVTVHYSKHQLAPPQVDHALLRTSNPTRGASSNRLSNHDARKASKSGATAPTLRTWSCKFQLAGAQRSSGVSTNRPTLSAPKAPKLPMTRSLSKSK